MADTKIVKNTVRHPPAAGKGRPKGSPNKITALLKDEILQAADEAHPEGRVGYLREQATANAPAFLTLLGKILPSQVDLSNSDGTLSKPTTILLKGPDDNGSPGDSA